MVVAAVVYADFSGARCYLASQLVDRLRLGGRPIEWRAIEGESGLPVGGRRRTPAESSDMTTALAGMQAVPASQHGLLDDPPDLIPNPTAAVSAYAEGVVAHAPDAIRRTLFSAYWRHGIDIGNPEKLRTVLAPAFMRSDATSDPIKRFGYAVAMTREPITTAAWELIRSWREEWAQVARNELPVLVEGTDVCSGVDALARLAAMLQADAAGAIDTSSASTVHWAPRTTVTPPETWTSGVGDPWRRAALIQEHELATDR
ncbi:hypothetical protein V3G39_14540 [Dermatophilaceae bacterium Sec6.4]